MKETIKQWAESNCQMKLLESKKLFLEGERDIAYVALGYYNAMRDLILLLDKEPKMHDDDNSV